ncbi:DUF4867 family protein [Pseudalkalibacillus decolorationis]|uniref:DUF4867 family protein n=1 Tax=Pseudalkalibacillus decolorationis TaxID=163879 RepID=UPI002148DE5E|nr:DUF4867 family protein [Pseudalkalibacillus decolorationis]
MIDILKRLNPSLDLADVRDHSFLRYGKVLEDFPIAKMEELMKETKVPKTGNDYVHSVSSWEEGDFKLLVESEHYGGMDIQIGYCNGKNSSLNALEYHKGSEINVSITDFVLLVGHVNDLVNGTFAVENIVGFFVPKGTAIEMYQTTLHLAPCKVSAEGFKCAVILPRGTNTPLLEGEQGLDSLLFMRNKWLITHPDAERFVSNGAHVGIDGPNISVIYPD